MNLNYEIEKNFDTMVQEKIPEIKDPELKAMVEEKILILKGSLLELTDFLSSRSTTAEMLNLEEIMCFNKEVDT